MAQKKNTDIQFPLGGLNRAVAFQKQPPYTTPDCQNMVLYDNITGRARGSTRPGFGLTSDPTNTPTGYPVNMLDSVTYMLSDGFKEDTDDFESDTLGDAWEQCVSVALPTVSDGKATSTGTTYSVAARVAETNIDTASKYSVEIYILPYDRTHSAIYYLGGMFDNTSPDPSNNGFIAALTLNGDEASCTLYKNAAGVITAVTSGSNRPFLLEYSSAEHGQGVAITSDGDVYFAIYQGLIYKQTSGTGSFVAQTSGGKLWEAVAAAPNGDIWAVVYGGDIYKQTSGTGSFVAQSLTANWLDVAVHPDGTVFVVQDDVGIYTLISGVLTLYQAGDYIAIAISPDGDIYAAMPNGDIYKQILGTGSFVAQSAGNRNWQGLTINDDGDVYATVGDADIYKQTGGTGSFVAQGGTSRKWRKIDVSPDGNVYVAVDAVGLYTNQIVMPGPAGWFAVTVVGTTVSCIWQGLTMCSGTVTGLLGKRFGFGIQGLTSTSVGLVDSFRARYYTTEGETRQVSTLIAASNGILYRRNDFGYMEAVSSNLTLASDRYLSCAERTQKVYIADNSEIKVDGSDGAISSGAVLTATGVSDWTTYGINKYTDVVMLSSTTGSTAGQYTITNVAAGGLTLSPAPGSGTGSYSVSRGAKVYDPIANTLTLWTATSGKGSVPVNCTMVCRYRDRIVLSGAADFPQLWYMSRQGDPLDWDYNPTITTGAAVAGSNSESGALGEPITAIIPYGDDYLLFGCPNSLWILRGDPTYGGSIDNISKTVGIVGRKAWCIGPSGEFIFCSRNGIYAMSSPTALSAQMISRAVLPKELLNISTNDNDVFLAYDIKLQAVHIIRTPSNSSVKYNYMLDWNTKTFWPVTSTQLTTSSICEFYSPNAESTAVLFGGRDGGIRRYDTRYETDGTEDIESYVLIGPLALGNGINLGTLTDMVVDLGLDSGSVLVEILVGTSPEQALRNTAVYSSTLSKGVSYHLHPRCRGMTAFIKLSNVSGSAWSYERLIAEITAGGMQRL